MTSIKTVLFTDLEGSTARWEEDASMMRALMALHDDIVRTQLRSGGGEVFKSTGDGVAALFETSVGAVRAAVALQRSLQKATWPGTRPQVRVGIHRGAVSPALGDYYGAAVHRAARIADAAHGDQIIVSANVAAAVAGHDHDLLDLGSHLLRGIGTERLHRVIADGLHPREDPPRVRSMRSMVPPPNRRTIGRAAELENISRQLRQHRVVTIVGSGGVGKTHLAYEVGRSVAARYDDGVVVVPLASIDDPHAVAAVVADAVGARTQPGMGLVESIVDYLAPRRMLVILDNCEHVRSEALDIASTLRSLPGVDILTTSRSRLGLAAEKVVILDPLPVATDAVELLRECASQIGAPQLDTSGPIVDICRLVGGLPLGIELAAAWLPVLSANELHDRLSSSIDVGSGDAVDERQATMRSTIQWSIDQLTPAEAELFAKVSVFATSFTVDAAAFVAGPSGMSEVEVLGLLRALVEKSMLSVDASKQQLRFSMLRPVQFLAFERLVALGQHEWVRVRLAEYVVSMVAVHTEQLISSNERAVWSLLSEEWPNIRRSVETLFEQGELSTASGLLVNLGWFATLSLRTELFAWADRLITMFGNSTDTELGSLYGLSAIHRYLVLADDGRQLAERGLEFDPTDPHGFCRIALGSVWVKNQHTDAESDSWTADGLSNLTASSPPAAVLWAHVMRSFHLANHDPTGSEAPEHVRTLEELAVSTRSPTAETLARFSKGMLMVCSAQAASADAEIEVGISQLRTAQEVARGVHDLHLVGWLARGLELHFICEQWPIHEVLGRSYDAVEAAAQHHYLAGTSHLLGVVAVALNRVGRPDVAAQLIRTMRSVGHNPRPIAEGAGPRVSAEELLIPLTVHEATALALAELDAARARTLPS